MATKRSNLSRRNITASTQKYLDIAEIRDDVVILRDGSLRAVLLVSSINFSLKSEEEQNAIIAAYVSFLNNIDSPIQIVIQSRELNIEDYLNQLRQKEKEQTNQLLKMQIREYINYVRELVAMSKIMNKRFYIVVQYNPMADANRGFFARLMDVFRPITIIKMRQSQFLRRKKELMRRLDVVITGLASMGLNSQQLDTQALIELYYNTYNPITSPNQRLANVNELRVRK
ncbi:hypothetical protein D6821_00825 [Candidatus Parcubacteria bacterium]|nr:MAG: hypothetical protein D6821_00825 [Candidatus Parcubacteria bacterium]